MIDGVTMDVSAIMVGCTLVTTATIQVNCNIVLSNILLFAEYDLIFVWHGGHLSLLVSAPINYFEALFQFL